MSSLTPNRYQLGDFEVDLYKCLITEHDEEIHLPELPFRVLLYLVENRDRYVSRQELLEKFWQGSESYEETLTKCISTVRTQLNDPPTAPRFIETRKKVGYRYIGPFATLPPDPIATGASQFDGPQFLVEKTRLVDIVVEEDDDSEIVPHEKRIDLVPTARLIDAGEGSSRRISSRHLFILLTTVVALGIATLFISRRIDAPTTANTKTINSIAVLPLKNMTGDPANEYFSDGLSESLISSLSKMRDVKIVARSSVFRFKNSETDPRELGRQLGVDALVEGSLKQLGEAVQVSIRLVNASDGRVIWASDERARAFGSLFDLQDEIARDVASHLRGQLTGELEKSLAKRYTDNTEAYQLYLQGRFYVNNYGSGEDLLKSIKYLEQAIDRDPKFALAYAGLADAYTTLATDWRAPREVFPKAQEYADKALELDPTLGEAHWSRGAVAYFYEWDWDKAGRELDTSLDLDAKTIEGNACYLHAREALGRPADAMAVIRRAIAQNPLSVIISSELGCAAYYAQDYDEALSFANDTLHLDQQNASAHYNAARALGQKGQFDRALSEMEKVKAVWGSTPTTMSEIGYLYAASGRRAEARKVLAELEERSHREFVDPYPLAFIQIALGDNDATLTALERAYAARSFWMPWLNVEPKFFVLHSDPRFMELLKRLRIQATA